MCQYCEGSGFVQIVCRKDHKTIRETWPGGPPDRFDSRPLCNEAVRPLHLGTYTVPCICRKPKPGAHPLDRFDPVRDCPFDGKDYQAVRDWFANREAELASSRQFQEWSP